MSAVSFDEAVTEAIAGWRASRHPRFAAVADWATAKALPAARAPIGLSTKEADVVAWVALLKKGDVLDLPRLLTGLRVKKSAISVERINALGKLNDPRVVSGLLALLESPPFTARSAMPFFRACCAVLAASGDLRVKPGLRDLAARYKSIVTTTVSDDIAALLRRTAESIDDVKPGPLPAALEKKCVALERLFEGERHSTTRSKAQKAESQVSDDALLAAIYASPDDDAPRLVFSDTLTERGDVRGEFIALQLARARGNSTPEGRRRERELGSNAKNKARWSLPLSQGGECHLARGFPDAVNIDPRSVKHLVGQPALRTVQRIEGLGRNPSLKPVNALLFHENARHVTHVGTFQRELFDGLTGELSWSGVELSFEPSRADLARLPKLKSLSLGHLTDGTGKAFVDQAGLERFELTSRENPTSAAFLERMPALKHLDLNAFDPPASFATHLAALTRLETLQVNWAPAPGTIRLPKLRSLCTRWGRASRLELGPVLDEIPSLREFETTTFEPGVLELVLAAGRKRLARLETIRVGELCVARPYSADATLEVRGWGYGEDQLVGFLNLFAEFPAELAPRCVLKPRNPDPTFFAPPPPDEALVARFRAANPALNIAVEWD